MLIPFRLVSFMKDKHTDLVSKWLDTLWYIKKIKLA
jgi:hypothetical protein